MRSLGMVGRVVTVMLALLNGCSAGADSSNGCRSNGCC